MLIVTFLAQLTLDKYIFILIYIEYLSQFKVTEMNFRNSNGILLNVLFKIKFRQKKLKAKLSVLKVRDN